VGRFGLARARRGFGPWRGGEPPISVYHFSFWKGIPISLYPGAAHRRPYKSSLFCIWLFISLLWPYQAPVLTFRGKIIDMLTVILLLAGLACFVLFFRSIDFFDKI
jgi:hypothetical protein